MIFFSTGNSLDNLKTGGLDFSRLFYVQGINSLSCLNLNIVSGQLKFFYYFILKAVVLNFS